MPLFILISTGTRKSFRHNNTIKSHQQKDKRLSEKGIFHRRCFLRLLIAKALTSCVSPTETWCCQRLWFFFSCYAPMTVQSSIQHFEIAPFTIQFFFAKPKKRRSRRLWSTTAVEPFKKSEVELCPRCESLRWYKSMSKLKRSSLSLAARDHVDYI